MKVQIVLLVVALSLQCQYCKFLEKENNKIVGDDDQYLDLKGIVLENGLIYEEYNVTTSDGYILLLQRIRQDLTSKVKGVVLLQHGLEDCSDMWVTNSPDKAPAFILSNDGWDVWLGNNRGNYYSSHSHLYLDPTSKEYYEFDFEQMGLYDQPAQIDFILQHTNQSYLDAYIGHSEGTTQMFIGASLLPQYFRDRIRLFAALAPVAKLDHQHSGLLTYISQYSSDLFDAAKFFHLYNIMPRNYLSGAAGDFCYYLPIFCNLFKQGLTPSDQTIDNADRFAVDIAHSPSGSGWRNIDHYAQIIQAKQFQRYDYGQTMNLRLYNSSTPPAYDLSKIEVATALFQGDLDDYADPEDVEWLCQQELSGFNVKEYLVFRKTYHFYHNSFNMAKDMSYIKDDLIPLILQQQQNHQQKQSIQSNQ